MGLPVLEPDLDLARAKARNFSGQALSVGGIWVWLFGKFAHQESGLLVGESEGN